MPPAPSASSCRDGSACCSSFPQTCQACIPTTTCICCGDEPLSTLSNPDYKRYPRFRSTGVLFCGASCMLLRALSHVLSTLQVSCSVLFVTRDRFLPVSSSADPVSGSSWQQVFA